MLPPSLDGGKLTKYVNNVEMEEKSDETLEKILPLPLYPHTLTDSLPRSQTHLRGDVKFADPETG